MGGEIILLNILEYYGWKYNSGNRFVINEYLDTTHDKNILYDPEWSIPKGIILIFLEKVGKWDEYFGNNQ